MENEARLMDQEMEDRISPPIDIANVDGPEEDPEIDVELEDQEMNEIIADEEKADRKEAGEDEEETDDEEDVDPEEEDE